MAVPQVRAAWLGPLSVKKSSVSRSFVKASAKQVRALAERRFDGERFPVIYIDGTPYAGETMIAALGITEDGTKRLLGVRQGATENAAVCTALLEDLCGRGLETSSPTLSVLDGAKALHAAYHETDYHQANRMVVGATA